MYIKRIFSYVLYELNFKMANRIQNGDSAQSTNQKAEYVSFLEILGSPFGLICSHLKTPVITFWFKVEYSILKSVQNLQVLE
jgi:hypothetical protein